MLHSARDFADPLGLQRRVRCLLLLFNPPDPFYPGGESGGEGGGADYAVPPANHDFVRDILQKSPLGHLRDPNLNLQGLRMLMRGPKSLQDGPKATPRALRAGSKTRKIPLKTC